MVLLVVWTLFCSRGPALAESEAVDTIGESIAEALKNNWDLKAIRERIQQAGHVKRQARAEFFPKLSTSYGYLRQSEQRAFRSTLPGGKIAVSSKDNYEWRGTLMQPVFTGFSLISSYRLAQLGLDQSELDYELGRLELALQVKEAYFGVLIAEKGIEVADKEVEALEEQVKVSRNFYEVGMIPVNDLLKVEVDLADSKQKLVEVINRARLAHANFNRVLARPVNDPVRLKDVLTYSPVAVDFDVSVEKALANRPEIKLIDVRLLQVEQERRLAMSEYYPQVSLTYEYIKEGDDPDVSGSPFHDAGRWEAMLGLSWTFWEWGRSHYAVKEKESLRDELLKTLASLEDGIRVEVKEAMLALDATEKMIPVTKKAVEQGEENLRVNKERYKAQVTTISEVLDAQALLTQARVNYYRALYEHHLARARLERALGTY
jgi:outer membrane protein TolC